MYLKHFGFNELPFTLTPNLRFFCDLTAYKEALDTVMVSLQNGDGFIKITGEVGTGKTLLCRKLLNLLDNEEYVTAYISNGALGLFDLQKAIAQELEIDIPDNISNHKLLTLLNSRLIALYNYGKRAVVIVDEAHALSDKTLEGLRLLGNLETESSKLLQIVLVGQPELNRKLKKTHLRQLEHRIVFSYSLPTLRNKKDLLTYICYRLASAGYRKPHSSIFSPRAIKLLLKKSKGIPRLVNILCHKALLITYGYNKEQIDTHAIKMAVADTDSITNAPTIAITIDNLFKIILPITLTIVIVVSTFLLLT